MLGSVITARVNYWATSLKRCDALRNTIVTPAMARGRRTAPRPPSENSPKLVALGLGALWRVHSNSYRATQFNPSNRGDARFSPIGRPDGTTIPMLYRGKHFGGGDDGDRVSRCSDSARRIHF